MRFLSQSFRAWAIAALLAVALGAMAWILYFGQDPLTRLGIGLFLLAIVMWGSGKLGIVEWVAVSVGRRFKRRKYLLLRAEVDNFIKDVRRLNWLVMDAERGIRPKQEMQADLAALEEKLHEQVHRIRKACGRVSEEREVDSDIAEYPPDTPPT